MNDELKNDEVMNDELINDELINDIIIFRTETLTNDIINYGFTDYNNKIDNIFLLLLQSNNIFKLINN